MSLLLVLSQLALGSSLDIVEVAGPWGSPASTDATAVWWNPAGLARGSGTRFHSEGALLTAGIAWDREDPYYGGSDSLRTAAIAPHLAIASDFGVDGLGVGLSLAVPYARAGQQADPIPFVRDYEGPIPFDNAVGRYHTRDAAIEVLQTTVAAGYEVGPVSFGAGVGMQFSRWTADLDNVLLPDLNDQIEDLNQDPGYTDDMIEDPRYAATATFGDLRDTVLTFNVGAQVEAVEDVLLISAAYHHSTRVDNTGDVQLQFSCPPQDDTLGRFGAEAFGLCNTDIDAAASIAYALPARAYGSVKLIPTPMLDLELMGGIVTWSRYKDFVITIDDVENRNDVEERTAELVTQNRLWARDNVNTGWLALDGKVHIDKITAGLRVTYDGNAVPDQALILNNYDATKVIVGGMGSYTFGEKVTVGLSYSHAFHARRTITDSGYGVTLDPENRKEDRWFYPQGNGTYTGAIDRLALVVRGQFGGDED